MLRKICQSKQGSIILLYEVHRIDKSKAQKVEKQLPGTEGMKEWSDRV